MANKTKNPKQQEAGQIQAERLSAAIRHQNQAQAPLSRLRKTYKEAIEIESELESTYSRLQDRLKTGKNQNSVEMNQLFEETAKKLTTAHTRTLNIQEKYDPLKKRSMVATVVKNNARKQYNAAIRRVDPPIVAVQNVTESILANKRRTPIDEDAYRRGEIISKITAELVNEYK